MSIKMVVCDLDNTLLNDDGRISERNLSAVKRLDQQGVQFVIASGRTIRQIEKPLVQLGTVNRENNYSITMNGGVMVENKKNRKIATSYFKYEDLCQLLEFSLFEGFSVHFQTDDLIYLCNPTESEVNYLTKQGLDFVIIYKNQFSYLKNVEVGKVLYQHDDVNYLKELSTLVDIYCDAQLSISYSANRYMEINCGKINKGKSVQLMSDYLNVPISDVLAIGDNYNDLEMLHVAGYSACPKNAIMDVKNSCNFVSNASNNHDAIAEILQHFNLGNDN